MKVRLALFAKDDEEYVVIITEPVDVSEHCEPGFQLQAVLNLDVAEKDISRFPSDRVLRPE